jgi:hypothetical protein
MTPSEKEQKLERLLDEKSFDQLTHEEKEVVLQEFGSEEQYRLARKIGPALVKLKTGLSPDPWILASLQDRAKLHRRPSLWTSFFQAQVPAYVVAGVCLVLVVMMWWLKPVPAPPAVAVRMVRDTVYLASTPDTVYRPKIIYRYRYRYITVAAPSPASSSAGVVEPVAESAGVTMKDKEELEKLLVSGSDK